MSEFSGEAIAVVGLHYGDEGKAKIVDALAESADFVARGNGGANAGHTIKLDEHRKVTLHQIPSGILHEGVVNVIGNGVYLDPVRLVGEINELREQGVDVTPDNLRISDAAHLVLPTHIELDRAREEGGNGQGSTKAGIAYVAADKYSREGTRLGSGLGMAYYDLSILATERRRELARRHGLSLSREAQTYARVEARRFADAVFQLEQYAVDSTLLLNQALGEGKRIILEGAQAFGLDIDHGKYPNVTSSSATTAGLLVGTGLPPQSLKRVIGVAKAIPSKVGGGAFPTRIEDEELASVLRGKREDIDGEFGGTSGRKREMGNPDAPFLTRAVMVNGVTEVALTKTDRLSRYGNSIFVAVHYRQTQADGSIRHLEMAPSTDEELSRCDPVYRAFPNWDNPNTQEAEEFLSYMESRIGAPITMLGTGPGRHDLYYRN